MDCKTARLLLEFQRPRVGELPSDEAAALEHHLACCPDCGAAARAERRLDDALGRAVRDVPLPDQLRERLLGRLKNERRTALRRKMKWAVPAFAAASLLVGTLVWWHFVGSQPAHFEVYPVAVKELDQHRLFTAESVQDWFQKNHQVTMVAPQAFNYTYLVETEMVDIQGKRVPKLAFHRGVGDNDSTRASVYVVTQGQFDLESLSATGPGPFENYGQHLKVWPPRTERLDTAYVIFFDGDSLEPLLVDNRPL